MWAWVTTKLQHWWASDDASRGVRDMNRQNRHTYIKFRVLEPPRSGWHSKTQKPGRRLEAYDWYGVIHTVKMRGNGWMRDDVSAVQRGAIIATRYLTHQPFGSLLSRCARVPGGYDTRPCARCWLALCCQQRGCPHLRRLVRIGPQTSAWQSAFLSLHC